MGKELSSSSNFTQYMRSFFTKKKLKRFEEYGWSFMASTGHGVLTVVFIKGNVKKSFAFSSTFPSLNKEIICCQNVYEFYKYYYKILKDELCMPNDFYSPQDIVNQKKVINLSNNANLFNNLFYESYKIDENDNIIGEINTKQNTVVIKPKVVKKIYSMQPNYLQFT